MKAKKDFSYFKKRINDAFLSDPIDRNLFVDIITEIHSLIPTLDDDELLELEAIYSFLGDLLFDNNISLPEYNVQLFSRSASIIDIDGAEERQVDLEEIFLGKLGNIISCIKDTHSIMRRSIFIKADSKSATDFKVFILYDQFSDYPFINKIKNSLNEELDLYRLDETNTNPESIIDSDYSYIIFISLSPNSFEIYKLDEFWNKLSDEFNIQKIDIDFSKLDDDYFTLNGSVEAAREELKYITGIELINGKMSSEESNILRKLFKDYGFYALEYSVLGGGFTSSHVYLIKKHGISSKYFMSVVKIGNKKENTLAEEKRNFKRYVENFDKDYTIAVEETERLVAICYAYGSLDAKSPADPFSVIYKSDKIDLINIIDNLFSIPLMKDWLDPWRIEPINIANSYKNHIKLDKIYPKIIEILDKTDEELFEKFQFILKHSLKVKTKICHGDLHTDNFLYDGKKVFLIDFGHTGVYHSLIDHTTLECAIKFRHIPKYINIDDLIKIEEELLELDSFSDNYKFTNIKRSDLHKPFNTIKHIRSLAIPLFIKPDEHLEYLFSLFAITLRQIRYPDVNQKYALECTRLLANYLISKIT